MFCFEQNKIRECEPISKTKYRCTYATVKQSADDYFFTMCSKHSLKVNTKKIYKITLHVSPLTHVKNYSRTLNGKNEIKRLLTVHM